MVKNKMDKNADDIFLEKKFEKITLGNINDSIKSSNNYSVNNNKNDNGYFVSEETEEGLIIRFIDKNVNTSQKNLNVLHK